MQHSQINFLHISKTGGTATKHALRPYALRHEIALHGHQVSLKHVPVGGKVFFCVRDPLSRFISAFYSRQRQGLPRYYWPWSQEEAQAFSYFDTPTELGEALGAANSQTQSRALVAMNSIGHIRDGYRRWLGPMRYFKGRIDDILYILQQESLHEDFARLIAILKVLEKVDLPSDAVASHRNPQECDYSLSRVATRNLKAWYAQDFRYLEVCRAIRRHRIALAGD